MFDFLINTKTINPLAQDLIAPVRTSQQIDLIDLELITIERVKIEPLMVERFNQLFKQSVNQLLQPFDWVVVSSINSLIHCPKKILKQLQLKQIPVAAVGQSSAQYAKTLGLNLKLISKSSSLEGLISSTDLTDKQHFLFLKGKVGNFRLINHLKEQKKSIQVLEVYQRKEKKITQKFIKGLIDKKTLWIFYSQSALVSAYNNFKNNKAQLDWLLNQGMIAFSPAIAERAKQFGFGGQVEILEQITPQLLNQKIVQLIQAK